MNEYIVVNAAGETVIERGLCPEDAKRSACVRPNFDDENIVSIKKYVPNYRTERIRAGIREVQRKLMEER